MYARMLERAFGGQDLPFKFVEDMSTWTESCRQILRAAVLRRYREANREKDATEILEQIPSQWVAKKTPKIPSEEEALRYEKAAGDLPPGAHALALLPLKAGLRAEELLTLKRSAVKRTAKGGELVLLRKGGQEQSLPLESSKDLFEELLGIPRKGGGVWENVGEILSSGAQIVQYHRLWELVRETGEKAGIDGLRPHLLRHAFATRMNRDGAPLATISWALGHANIQTTMRYVHPGAEDAKKYLR